MISKRLLSNIAVAAIAILISVLVLELYARIFLTVDYFSLSKEVSEVDKAVHGKYIVYDEVLGFVPGPGWRGRNGRYGFQNGSEYYMTAEDGISDIIILGDSIIQSRDLEHSLKYLLRGIRFRVWNAGVGGYNTIQEAYYLLKYIKINPDMIILGFCLNDFTPSMTIIPDSFGKKRCARLLFEPLGSVNPVLFRHSALYRFLKVRLMHLPTNEGLYTPASVVNNRRIVKTGLEMINQYCLERKIPFIVLIYPYLEVYSKEDEAWLKQAFLSVTEILEELKIKYLDLHQAYGQGDLRKFKRSLHDRIHPNMLGEFIAGRELIGKFYPEFGLTKEAAQKIASATYSEYEKYNPHD
ncbi:MAG TPA: SGNH/GDSL hydrolase family protein [Candidatus Margulisiibacteriota bacterium]|nr:SGNH/GDSL hydrolase family protein [Candidatus Margulisiibacteriota bacterium]